MSFKFIKLLGFIFGVVFILSNCGVKGQPQVPDYPPFIGNGLNEESRNHSGPESAPKIEEPTALSTATPVPEPIETSKPKSDKVKGQKVKGKKK